MCTNVYQCVPMCTISELCISVLNEALFFKYPNSVIITYLCFMEVNIQMKVLLWQINIRHRMAE